MYWYFSNIHRCFKLNEKYSDGYACCIMSNRNFISEKNALTSKKYHIDTTIIV